MDYSFILYFFSFEGAGVRAKKGAKKNIRGNSSTT